jgi:hypothetical protein
MGKKIITRPPRLFIKRGKLYIRIGKKKKLIKDQADYTKRELLDIILSELLVRRKKRRRGGTTRRELKLNKKELETFNLFEKMNRSKSKYLKIPGKVKETDAEKSVYTALIKAFSPTNMDVNKETRMKPEEKKTPSPSNSSALIPVSPTIPKPPSSTSRPALPPKGRTVIPRDQILGIYFNTVKLNNTKYKPILIGIAKTIPGITVKNRQKIEEIFDMIAARLTPDELVSKFEAAGIERPSRDIPYMFADMPAIEDEKGEVEPETSELEKATVELNDLVQEANGDPNLQGGLDTGEIDGIMKTFKSYMGTFPSNFLKDMDLKKMPKRFGFIMNLDNSDKKGSHWIAVMIDSKTDMSVEYYDSFGAPPTKDFLNQIKQVIDNLDCNLYLKFKTNKIVEQDSNSTNCGWFCMNFLMKRFNDVPFREVSGYDDSLNGETEILDFKEKFGYI